MHTILFLNLSARIVRYYQEKSAKTKDYYQEFEIARNATSEQIRRSHCELKKLYKNSNNAVYSLFTEEDLQQQSAFWKLFESHDNYCKYHGIIHPEARVGAHFLRNNPEWLN